MKENNIEVGRFYKHIYSGTVVQCISVRHYGEFGGVVVKKEGCEDSVNVGDICNKFNRSLFTECEPIYPTPEEKIVIVHNEDLSSVNKMLKNGWSVKNMSSCGYQWDNQGVSSCYICLIRDNWEDNN